MKLKERWLLVGLMAGVSVTCRADSAVVRALLGVPFRAPGTDLRLVRDFTAARR